MASKMEFDIMISYNQESGTDCMNKLLTELKTRGYKVWADVEQMHGKVYNSMAEGIASSFIIVPLVSEAYELSPNCELELKHAQKIRKAIIPVKIEDYHPPNDSWLSIILSDHCYYKIFGDVDQTDKLIFAIEEELKKCKTDLNPTKRLPTQESASNLNQNYDESTTSMSDERSGQQNDYEESTTSMPDERSGHQNATYSNVVGYYTNVELPTRTIYGTTVLPSTTVKEYMNDICQKEGLKVEEYQLVFNGKPMNPMKTLSEEGVVPVFQESRVMVLVRNTEWTSDVFRIQIRFKLPTGRVGSMNFPRSTTSKEVLNKICELGFPVEEYQLVFNGSPMNPIKTLSEEGVVPGSTIHVVRRARGEYR